MDRRYGPPSGPQEETLAAARQHVRTLSDCGREALLQALLELEQPSCSSASIPPAPNLAPAQIQPATGPMYGHYQGRLSVSTTSSSSTSGKASFMSTAPSARTSVSSQGSRHSQTPSLSNPTASKPSTRAYWCTSCGVKLARKFDWKRHDEEFHERPRKYPCPSCNRVFWGANTFNQHHKSAHGCQTCPHADKVMKYSKRKRAWGCGFCAAFLGSLDRYHEHVALHYESGKTLAHWDHANVIYGLLHQPIIHEAWKQLQAAKFGHLPQEQRPKLSWDPRTTKRAHGFIENEAPGQLQDLLEFFDPSHHSAEYIVQLADEKAMHITLSVEDSRSLSPDSPPRPPAHLTTAHTSLPVPKSKWASSGSSQPSIIADAFAPRLTVAEPSMHFQQQRPLPRVTSQDIQPTMDYSSGGQEINMDFFSVESQQQFGMRNSVDMFRDWDSLASTIVDDLTHPLSAPRHWSTGNYTPSAGGI